MNRLSRDYRTLIKRLQHSYESPIKRLQDSYQEITAKHNKMLEYLNFFLICILFTYLYARVKRYLPPLKMAEEPIGNLDYDDTQSDTKCQKLFKCVLTGNSKLYLGKVYTEDQLAKLSEEKVEELFNNYEAKLSGQMVKSLGCSIINIYSMGASAALGITYQDALT